MLKKISCDRFMADGKPRGEIVFNSGLNVVIGGHKGTNSIGKSTFLLILDFVFGGNDYLTIATDAQKYLHNHEFKFEHEFQGKSYYFSRSTGEDNYVYEYDEKGKQIKRHPLADYNNWLQKMYGLDQVGITFRDCVGRFIRVANRENLDTHKPLETAKHQSEADGIASLLKLFDAYGPIQDRKKAYLTAKEEESGFKSAQKFHYIPAAHNQTEVKRNETRIAELDHELEDLSRKNNEGLLQLSTIQKKQLGELGDQLSVLDEQKTNVEIQLRGIRKDKDAGKKRFQKNYESLLRFFPEVNIQKLETVESFHKQITTVLKSEFKATEAEYESMLDALNKDIAAIEQRMKEVAEIPNLSEAIIKEVGQKENERRTLQKANESFVKNQELHSVTQHEEDLYNQMTLEQVLNVQNQINKKLEELNAYVCGPKSRTTPVLNVQGAKKYTFITDSDKGTGNAYKNLILFDISCLQLTKLPFLIHDSLLFDHIESDRVEKILDLYNNSGKQIFISLDREFNYTEESQKIIEDHELMHLERGGRELFGVTWSDLDLPEDKNTETEG